MSSTVAQLESFGAIDAETDFRPDFFVPSTSWERTRNKQHPIVIGRKGTGKTALRKALLDLAGSSPMMFARDLGFRDYPWNVHYSVVDSEVGGRSRYLETWLFLMLVELAKLRLGEDATAPEGPDAIALAKGVEDFIEKNWGSLTFDHKDTFRASQYEVTKSLRPQVAGTGLGAIDWKKIPRGRLGDSLNAMNRWLKEALSHLLRQDCEYFLIFDELDLDFDRRDEQYLDSMIGLVLAAQNLFLWVRELGIDATPVVLLRDDIYRGLQFPDKNKITHSLVETIYWESTSDGPNSLKTVVDTRIQALLDSPKVDDPWSLVFDDEVMRGTQHKYLHMVQRTYLRPRDIIQFANYCLDEAKGRTAAEPKDGDRIRNEDITSARVPYSGYLRAELGDEIFAHHENWEQWLELLRRVGTLTFSGERFEEVWAESPELAKEQGVGPTAILESLYEFGVIGFGRRGGAGRGGTDEYWSFKDPEVTFDPRAPFFKVHLGLKENLDLKEERR
jgi:hypothetical protein